MNNIINLLLYHIQKGLKELEEHNIAKYTFKAGKGTLFYEIDGIEYKIEVSKIDG
jgi:DNA-binding transcriptional regulator GbsR (MarR family)